MRGNRRFAFRLCKVLGYAHPDKLLGELSASQFEEWKVYNAIEPISNVNRIEYSVAVLSSLVMNLAQSMYSKSPKEFSPEDFVINWDEPYTDKPIVKQSDEEMKDFLLGFAKIHNRRNKNHEQKRNNNRGKNTT